MLIKTCIVKLRNGKSIDLLNPDPVDIDIEHIAKSLSEQNRGIGCFDVPFNVAEHSVLVADRCPDCCQLEGLLHDAAEAYIGDLPGPLKAFLPDYRAVETVMMGAIADRFGLAVGYEFVVKECDRACEKLELMAMSGEEVGIRFLDSRSAKALFIERFEQWSRV